MQEQFDLFGTNAETNMFENLTDNDLTDLFSTLTEEPEKKNKKRKINEINNNNNNNNEVVEVVEELTSELSNLKQFENIDDDKCVDGLQLQHNLLIFLFNFLKVSDSISIDTPRNISGKTRFENPELKKKVENLYQLLNATLSCAIQVQNNFLHLKKKNIRLKQYNIQKKQTEELLNKSYKNLDKCKQNINLLQQNFVNETNPIKKQKLMDDFLSK